MHPAILIGLRTLPLRLVYLMLGLVIILSCTQEEPVVKPPAEQYPSSESTNATTVFLTGSVVTTRIKSGRIISYTEQDSAWAFELFVDFYDSVGAHTSTLRSDSALVRERRRRLDVFGNVKVTTDKGTTLDSDHLAWSDSSRTISTDSLVVITQGKDVMSGYGFTSDPELTRIVFRRQVSGRLADPEALEPELEPADADSESPETDSQSITADPESTEAVPEIPEEDSL